MSTALCGQQQGAFSLASVLVALRGRRQRAFSLASVLVALRGRRQRATRPLATPARDFVPWNPDLMHSQNTYQAHMPMGRSELAVYDPALSKTEACANALIVHQALL